MTTNIQPGRGVLLVRVASEEDIKTQGGILIPTKGRKYDEAEVLAVGEPEVVHGHLVYSLYNVGDTVLVPKGAGADIEPGLTVVSENEVIGKRLS